MGKNMLRRQNTVTTSFAHQLDQRRQSHVCFRMTLADYIKLDVLSELLLVIGLVDLEEASMTK